MTKDVLKSEAFQRAALKSESYRSFGLLILLAVLAVFVVARGVALGEYAILAMQLVLLGVVITHEALMLRAIKRAIRDGREIGPEKWVLNVFVESQIPTVGLFVLLSGSFLTAQQVLVAPIVLLYFLLIILSTLRLNPTLTVLTGLLSALGYLFVTLFTGMTSADASSFRLSFFFMYAGLIFAGGILAAIVAGRIRSHVAAALREAELKSQLDQVNHDLDIARSIQQDLLPAQSPNLENFDVAGWNEPANQTGGDYFDWQTLPDGRLAISLGDATGHGIGPALVSALCRAYARASLVVDNEHHKVLDRLNRLLSEDLSANRFVTFALVFLDPSKNEVEVLSAGHGPILRYKYATNELENLEAQGIPLGMIAGVTYEKALVRRLEPNDMIVLVTDGFYEWENPSGEEFGLQRLESVILQSKDCGAEEVIARLRLAVEDFCKGTEQKDDLTAVVLKRKAAATWAEARLVTASSDRAASHSMP
ncbi:MAG TPA: PP2C family protein-serine/threonine phosphatase [Pyrinomonadaceae bacterium]|nr:PP2C family protein-serine/threonine phosphatase [Pyrinomonadaceae bacterium]